MNTYDKDPVMMKEDAPTQAAEGQTQTQPQAETQTAPPPAQTPTAVPTQPVVQTPQTDPYADMSRQVRDDYATTLADIRRRRQELESRYQPNIERQRKIMKINALGKLLGQLGQLAGGGAGTPVVDKDPQQINAWNELNRMRNEQRYYSNQLDAEERAARQGMQQGLSRLNIEKAKAGQRMAEITQKYDLEFKKMGINAQLKAAFEKLKYDYNVKLQEARTEGQVAVIEANMRRDAAKLARQASNDEEKDKRRHQNKLDEIAAQGKENRETKSTPAGGSTVTYVGAGKGGRKGQNQPSGFGNAPTAGQTTGSTTNKPPFVLNQ